MAAERNDRVEQGFAMALEVPFEDRSEFLNQFCGGDLTLRHEIEDLLNHYRADDDLLATTTLDPPGALQAGPAPNPLPGTRIGPYEILKMLGRGGMGVVYLAKRADGAFERRFAIKLIDQSYSSSDHAEGRFERERKVLGQLDTPNIVKIVDAGSDHGLTYLVMEYIDGLHIDEYCRRNNLSIRQKLELFVQVAKAVSLAHNSRIVHRDLKPANILVDRSGTPYLIDFGISKLLDIDESKSLTSRGHEPMTLLYASPERIHGNTPVADLPSADIYSLGVILFELLTGKKPIELPLEISTPDVLRYLIDKEPSVPSKLNEALDRDIDFIVLKALRKDRRERYSSVEQFVSYIHLYLDHRPLPEGPPGLLYRSQKFLKRNRGAVLVAATIAAVLMGGIVATSRQARLAQRRFDEVRQIATSFLFDFDAKIADVKGATEARRLVVSKGLEYLDRLAQEAYGNTTLQDELADAYERLAGIQGNTFGSNLGEYRDAADSYEKALVIRKQLLQKNPRDSRQVEKLGDLFLQAADGWFTSGNVKEAVARYQEGIRIIEALPEDKGSSSEAANASIRRAYSRLCMMLLPAGDHEGAREYCDKYLDTTKAELERNPSDLSLRTAMATGYGQVGNLLRVSKKPGEAIPYFLQSISGLEALLTSSPTKSSITFNLGGAYAYLSASYRDTGQVVESLDAAGKGIELLRKASQTDPADARMKSSLAYLLFNQAGLLHEMGRLTEAREAGIEGLKIARQFAVRPQATPDDHNTYAHYLLAIGVPSLRNPQLALDHSKAAVAAVREPSLVLLSTLFDAYVATGDVPAAIRTGEAALASHTAPSGSAVGIRTDLERKLKEARKELDQQSTN
jgi:non-specific serine/threonine protein kinase/serine/threonine-protein kinase